MIPAHSPSVSERDSDCVHVRDLLLAARGQAYLLQNDAETAVNSAVQHEIESKVRGLEDVGDVGDQVASGPPSLVRVNELQDFSGGHKNDSREDDDDEDEGDPETMHLMLWG